MKNQPENIEQEVNQEEIETKKILFWNVKVTTIDKIRTIAIRTAEGVAVAVVMAAGAICVLAAKAKVDESKTTDESGEGVPVDGSCDYENVEEGDSEKPVKE